MEHGYRHNPCATWNCAVCKTSSYGVIYRQLLNEETVWDGITESSSVVGPRPIITEAEVTAALKGMKRGKAAGPSKVVAEMLRDGGDVGVKWLT
jgi:hypothetical protein